MTNQSSITETLQGLNTSPKSSDDPHDGSDHWIIPLRKERKQNETDKERSKSDSQAGK
jgi:hypothetical protein